MADPKWEETQPLDAPPKWEDTQPADASPSTSGVTAATTGLMNGASLSFAPAVGAMGKTAMDAITGVNGPLAGGNIDDLVDEYRAQRDKLKASFTKAAAAHPAIAMAGNVVGGGLGMGAAGLAAPKTAIGAMSQGAGIGAASGAGEGVSEGAGAEDIAKKAISGVALGAAGGLAGAGISRGIEALRPGSLAATAEKAAVKSLNPIKGQYQKLYNAGDITGSEGIGRTMLDNGAVTPFSSLEDKAASMGSLQDTSGKAIGNTLEGLDAAGYAGPSAGDLAQGVRAQALPLKNLKTAAPTHNALQDVAGDIEQMGAPRAPAAGTLDQLTGKGEEYLLDASGNPIGKFQNGNLATEGVGSGSTTGTVASNPNLSSSNPPGTFQGAQDIKKFVSDQIDAAGGWNAPNPSEKNQALQQVYGMIKGKIEESAQSAAESSGDQDLLKNYLKNKVNYGNAAKANGILDSSVSREAVNNRVGLGSTIMGAAEFGATGNPVKAAATMGVWHAGKSYANNFIALGADKLGQVLDRSPAVFGEFAGVLQKAAARGAVSLGATDYILQQTNPNYRAQRDKVFSGSQNEEP